MDETGQKNTVLTLYELVDGETTLSQGRSSTPALDILERDSLLIGDLELYQNSMAWIWNCCRGHCRYW